MDNDDNKILLTFLQSRFQNQKRSTLPQQAMEFYKEHKDTSYVL